MSATKPSLFDLAWSADTILVDDETAEDTSVGHFFGADHPRVLRLACTDGVKYYFADQEVDLQDDGEALVYSCFKEKGVVPTRHRMRFSIERPLTAADVQPSGF